MRRYLTIVLATCIVAAPAAAAEFAGVRMPDTATVAGKQIELSGMGLRERMMIDVYVAGLHPEDRASDAPKILADAGVKHLRMHFVYKKVADKKLSDAWPEGLESNAGDPIEALRSSLARLNSWMEEMVKGDEMAFTFVPGQGLRVEVKGREKCVIEDEAFSAASWSIFLGETPPTATLKKGLLGQG